MTPGFFRRFELQRKQYSRQDLNAAIAEEREAHRLTVKMAAELFDEIRHQWGQD